MSSIAPSSSLAVVSLVVVVVSAAEEAETERKTKTPALPLSSLRKETLAIERTYARNLIEFLILNWKCVLSIWFVSFARRCCCFFFTNELEVVVACTKTVFCVVFRESERRDVFVRTQRKECRSLVNVKISHKRLL